MQVSNNHFGIFKFHNFVNDICDSLVYLDSGLYVVDL